MRTRVSSALVAVMLFAAHDAAAGGPREPTQADQEFKLGREALKKQDYATACVHFAESQRLDPAPGTSLNLAECEQGRGRLATATQHLLDAKSRLPPTDPRLAAIDERLQSLEARVPHLTLRLAPAADGARVEVDDGAATLGAPVPLDPGAHRIRVAKPGFADRELVVTLVEGRDDEVDVAPGAAVAVTMSDPKPIDGSSRRTTGTIFVAAGGALAVGGLVTGLLTMQAASAYKEHCTAGVCDDEGLHAAERGRSLQVAAPVLLVTGALAAGAGTYLLLTAPKKATVGFSPGGVVVSGRF